MCNHIGDWYEKPLFYVAVEHPVLTSFIILLILAWLAPSLLGVVFIRERQVGIIHQKVRLAFIAAGAIDCCRR